MDECLTAQQALFAVMPNVFSSLKTRAYSVTNYIESLIITAAIRQNIDNDI